MSIIGDVEKKLGISFEDMSVDEKETIHSMLELVQKTKMTPLKLRDYILTLRSMVEKELVKEPEFIRVFIFKFRNDRNIFLKARLRNYMVLESFLVSPEKAKEQVESFIDGLVPVK